MFKLSTFNWLKVLSPVAIAASIFLATEVPANAVPRHSSGSFYRHKTVSSSPSLTITPRSPRSYYYRSDDYGRGRDRYRYDGYRRRRARYRYDDDCRRGRYRGRRRYSHGRRRYGSYKKGYGGLIIINPGRKY